MPRFIETAALYAFVRAVLLYDSDSRLAGLTVLVDHEWNVESGRGVVRNPCVDLVYPNLTWRETGKLDSHLDAAKPDLGRDHRRGCWLRPCREASLNRRSRISHSGQVDRNDIVGPQRVRDGYEFVIASSNQSRKTCLRSRRAGTEDAGRGREQS